MEGIYSCITKMFKMFSNLSAKNKSLQTIPWTVEGARMQDTHVVSNPLVYLVREISSGSSIFMMTPSSSVKMISPTGIQSKKLLTPNDDTIAKFAYYILQNEKLGNIFFIRKPNGDVKRFTLKANESLIPESVQTDPT